VRVLAEQLEVLLEAAGQQLVEGELDRVPANA
jgi:hypothetical protein